MSIFVVRLLLLLSLGNYALAAVIDHEPECDSQLDIFNSCYLPADIEIEILERLEWPDLLRLSAVNRSCRDKALGHLAELIQHHVFKEKVANSFVDQNTLLLNNLGVAHLMEAYFPMVAVTDIPISGWLLAAAYRAGEYSKLEWLHYIIGQCTANHDNRGLARAAIAALTSLGEDKMAAMRHFMIDAGYWIESELNLVRIIAASTSNEDIINYLIQYSRTQRVFMGGTEWTRRKNGGILSGAIESGTPGLVKSILIKLKYHPNIDYEALLLLAVQQNNLDALQALTFALDDEDGDIDIHGLLRAACYYAASRGLLEYLLEKGAGPNRSFTVGPNQTLFEGCSRLAFILRHQLTFERMGLTPLEIVSMHDDETVRREVTILLESNGARNTGSSSPRKQRFVIGQCKHLASLFSKSRENTFASSPPSAAGTHRLFTAPNGSSILLLSKPMEIEIDRPVDCILTLDDIVSCTVNDMNIQARIAAFSLNGDVFLVQDKLSLIFIRKRITDVIKIEPARL